MASLLLVFLVLGLTVAAPAPDQGFQDTEPSSENELAFMNFLNSRFRDIPYYRNRAARSNGKPTFIRFGKRSSDSRKPLEELSDFEWNTRY
ncbi:hypothetical protein FO519_007207 [Halicephalobus sp. NKZ332]|nr:hypothetical protein FO519_007207 [Halicephalobus sp. NKZ332]